MRMRVGFIGLGAIGWPMAGTLVKGGHDVLAFDIDRERLNRFATQFACPVASTLANRTPKPFPFNGSTRSCARY
ncbi:MAG: NAD(P)-dependent oxidoreductase [Xanthobacteraceae bacterium]|nr:NAD(P)-dependent oxidoreductase [Xanthobacteraceae bacterium]